MREYRAVFLVNGVLLLILGVVMLVPAHNQPAVLACFVEVVGERLSELPFFFPMVPPTG